MLAAGELAARLYEHLAPKAVSIPVIRVRMGPSYVAVQLAGGAMGLAALPLSEPPDRRGMGPQAEVPEGQATADHLLQGLLAEAGSVPRSLGLAVANAILSTGRQDAEGGDAVGLIRLTAHDRVAMVGHFPPLVSRIEATGATLKIIEKNPARGPAWTGQEKDAILAAATVAVITATTLLNDSLEPILAALGDPRHVAILGPSTPLCPPVFWGTPVNHLGGALARDKRKILQVISDGGGTPAMRPYLCFVNILF